MQRFISWVTKGPRSWLRCVRFAKRYLRYTWPVMTVMSWRWHSPPSSHTGQSWGWFVMSHSMTPARNARASGSSMDSRIPSLDRRHAGHDDPALGVMLVLEQLDRALPARADGMQRRVPAEVGQIEAEAEAGLEQVLARLHLVGFLSI